MTDKKLTISATLDTSSFDQQIQAIQAKLQKITQPSSTFAGQQDLNKELSKAGYQTASPQSEVMHKQALLKSYADIDKFIKSSVEYENRYIKLLDDKVKRLDALKKINLEDLKTEKERASVKEKINELGKEEEVIRGRIRGHHEGQRMALDQQGQFPLATRLRAAWDKGGAQGLGQGLMRTAGQWAPQVAGALGGAMTAIGAVGEYIGPMARETEGLKGSTIYGASDLARNAYQGTLQKDMFFASERQKAADIVSKEMENRRAMDNVKIGGGLLGSGALIAKGAALSTTGAGALAGVPMMGMGIYGLTQSLGGNRLDKLLGGLGYQPSQDRYEASIANEEVSKRNETRAALEQQKHLKGLARDRFEAQSDRNLSLSRQLGIGDDQMYGKGTSKGRGFLDNPYGFTEEQTIGASQSILSAGGSTSAARDSANMANIMARDSRMNLTNAGSVIGALSGGGMKGTKEQEEATIKILAEGMKRGLNGTEFAQEQRRFVQTVAEIAGKSGVSSAAGVQAVAATFGGAVTQTTGAGLTAAQGAFQAQEARFQQQVSPQALIRIAELKKKMPGLPYQTYEQLASLSPTEIQAMPDANPAAFAAIQQATGKSREEILKEQMDAAKSGTTTLANQAELQKKFGGMSEDEIKFKMGMGQIDPKEYLQYQTMQYATGATTANPFTLGGKSQIAYQENLGQGSADMTMDEMFGKAGGPLAGDYKNAAIAKQQKATREATADMFDEIIESNVKVAETNTAYIKTLLETNAAYEALAKSGADTTEALRQLDEVFAKISGKARNIVDNTPIDEGRNFPASMDK